MASFLQYLSRLFAFLTVVCRSLHHFPFLTIPLQKLTEKAAKMPLQRVCSRCPSSLPVIYTYKTCERCREARRKRPQLQLTPPSFLHYCANCKSHLPPTAFARAPLGKAPYTICTECNKHR